MATGTKNGRLIHYVYRGGNQNELISECGKSMETPNALYSTTRDKVTCPKCLKASKSLPDHGGDPRAAVRRYEVQLEIDCNRGVIYAHCKKTDVSILRICGVPMPAMRGLATTPIEFIPQLDITLRENMPPIAGVANLVMAKPMPEVDKAAARRIAAKKDKEAKQAKAKAKKKGPVVCFRIYEDGRFMEYSEEPNEKAAVRVYRKQHGYSGNNGVHVQAKMTVRRQH